MSMHTLQARMTALGGDQLGRINKQKLESLRWALKNDGNSRMIQTERGAIPALIVQDTASGLHSDYDKKYIAVPFDSGLECGDTFRIIDDDTYWMIYIPIVTETAYLRSQILRCRYQLEVNGKPYWVYFQGPTETDIRWNLKRNTEYNEPNLSGTIYIKADENTVNFFHRFTHIEIDGKPWEVQVPDEISVPGILELEVQEFYNNTPAKLPKIINEFDAESPIHGKQIVKQDSVEGYFILPTYYNPNIEWEVSGNPRVKLDEVFEGGRSCNVRIAPGAIKTFNVAYGDKSVTVTIDWKKPVIQGPQEVYPYDTHKYWLKNIPDDKKVFFKLSCDDKIARVKEVYHDGINIEITSRMTNDFVLYAKYDDKIYNLPIRIKSL